MLDIRGSAYWKPDRVKVGVWVFVFEVDVGFVEGRVDVHLSIDPAVHNALVAGVEN